MKKYWKVRVDSYFKKSLKNLGVDDEYIEILTDKYNSPMEYVREHNSKYIFICYDSDEKSDNKFGWEEIENADYMEKNYDFCGIINIRKDKLKKLNDLYKSAI